MEKKTVKSQYTGKKDSEAWGEEKIQSTGEGQDRRGRRWGVCVHRLGGIRACKVHTKTFESQDKDDGHLGNHMKGKRAKGWGGGGGPGNLRWGGTRPGRKLATNSDGKSRKPGAERETWKWGDKRGSLERAGGGGRESKKKGRPKHCGKHTLKNKLWLKEENQETLVLGRRHGDKKFGKSTKPSPSHLVKLEERVDWTGEGGWTSALGSPFHTIGGGETPK